MLDHCDATFGCLGRGLDRGQEAKEPEGFTRFLPECDRTRGAFVSCAHDNSFWQQTGNINLTTSKSNASVSENREVVRCECGPAVRLAVCRSRSHGLTYLSGAPRETPSS